jgi:catalase
LPEAAASLLARDAAAVQFVMDAFGHLKAIGASKGAQALLDKAGVEPGEGVTGLGEDFIEAAARRFYDREPKLRDLA